MLSFRIKKIECHRVKKTGKKQELIAMVSGCLAINKSFGPEIDDGKWYDLKRIQLENSMTDNSKNTA